MLTRYTNAVVFYDGPSALNGAPILGVLTGLVYESKNPKTGDMLQAWILLRDLSPREAIASGEDAAICGDCSLRGDGVYGRGCYVTYWQAPARIYSAIDRAPRIPPSGLTTSLRGRRVRLGAYGDPVAIPAGVWATLLRFTSGSIGYTQRWRTCAPVYRTFLMASVLSTVDRDEARARGWRTYRVRGPQDPIGPEECICPASEEADHKLTCYDCLLCDGAKSSRANPVIVVHGKPGNYAAFGLAPPTGKFPGRPRRPIIELRPV